MARSRVARFLRLALLAHAALGMGAAIAAPLPAQVELPVMRTSIYIGSVKLITSAFSQTEAAYTATYEAKVTPWSWWSESGTVALTLTPEQYARLLQGETIEFSGEATNDKGKLRQVTVRAQPADATTGRVKVKITASGTTLIFNSTYTMAPAAEAMSATASAN